MGALVKGRTGKGTASATISGSSIRDLGKKNNSESPTKQNEKTLEGDEGRAPKTKRAIEVYNENPVPHHGRKKSLFGRQRRRRPEKIKRFGKETCRPEREATP